jgi:signal transduction histidine kinase
VLKFRLKVKDEGIGISEEDQKKIFTPFFKQEDTTRQRSNEIRPASHGLGLYITKRIVEGLGGTIYFKSEIGAGTTFTLTFEVLRIRGDPAVSNTFLKLIVTIPNGSYVW